MDSVVSICCITYNHKEFIREAIDSFLMQQTNFEFEILINDDCSVDGTTDILKEFQQNHPDKIKLVLHDENEWSKGTKAIFARNLFPMAKGKYIALCEGDDYWTDPYKLQKQVDFLEINKDYSICFHPVKYLKEDGKLYNEETKQVSETTTIIDIAKGNYIHTPSVMFRRENIANLPEEFLRFPAGDYALHMFNAQFGKIKKLPESMAVYRIHSEGMWSSQSSVETMKKWLVQLTLLNKVIKHELALETVNKELIDKVKKLELITSESFNKFENIEDLKLLSSILSNELLTQSNSIRNNPKYLRKEVKISVLLRAILIKLFSTN